MATGTEGNDQLSNDPAAYRETVDAKGGDDVITMVRLNSAQEFPRETTMVLGGAGTDTLIMPASSPTNVLYGITSTGTGFDGTIEVRHNTVTGWNIAYSSIERLDVTGIAFFNGVFNPGDSDDVLRLTGTQFHGSAPTISTNGGNDQVYLSDYVEYARTVTTGDGHDIVNLRGVTSIRLNFFTVDGGAGDDLLMGTDIGDRLIGGSGNDILVGGGGIDDMIGGLGNDEYYVDSIVDGVTENFGEGIDTVRALGSFILAAGSHVEYLTTTNSYATTGIALTGNEFSQVLWGNYGANVLNGGGAADAMLGFGGDDEYYVDNAADGIVEVAGEGNDVVRTSVSYALGASVHVEMLTTTSGYGTTALNLSGNEFGQVIWGNYGANVINGGGGADAMSGFGGNDEYYVDNAADGIVEAAGEGTDTVRTSASYVLTAGAQVEALTTTNGYATTALNLTGNEFGQTIFANYGSNVIDGGGGADTLFGFGGADSFAFTTALGNGNVDGIIDFEAGIDRILLDGGAGGPFASLTPGALAAGSFVDGTTAADANDFILYDRVSGWLFYDADGNGAEAAVLFASVTAGTTLSAANFMVI